MENKKDRIKGLIFIISGPSGSGKTTLLKKVLADKSLSRRLSRSTSVTTRPKRTGERRGKDYFFVSQSGFQRLIKDKKILEWTKYSGYYYGTLKDTAETVLESGRHLALCLDLKGTFKLKRLYPRNAVSIFVIPPSIKELRKRIENRCSITKQCEINSRLQLAQAELKNSSKYDYVLKNRNLNQAVAKLKAIILKETGA